VEKKPLGPEEGPQLEKTLDDFRQNCQKKVNNNKQHLAKLRCKIPT
jgi:hypothetical protein